MLKINQHYLNHNYYTDIITFDNAEEANLVEGDLFISLDRVRANAKSYQTSFHIELLRVIVHGLLHLLGYDDHSLSSKKTMTNKEDHYLNVFFSDFNP